MSSVDATSNGVRAAPVDRWYSQKRLGGLSRFALAITILNFFGHVLLGFEQAWIVPFIALATAYAMDLTCERLDAWGAGRAPRYEGSFVDLVKFLLPAHITALAVGMLLYSAHNFAAVIFAVVVAIGSKYLFRIEIDRNPKGGPIVRHFLNPSNFGIAITLVLFPSVGIAPPYQFAENTWGYIDWLLPLIIIGTGSYLNIKATGRMSLIAAWVAAFAFQAVIRGLVHGTPIAAGLMPMTGFAFILFTFYMITDPATTPSKPRMQIVFAVSVALAYAILMELQVVFGLFFALAIVTALRGLCIFVVRRWSFVIGRPGGSVAKPTLKEELVAVDILPSRRR
ncbi:hypothetical protein [Mesorhizobium sp. L-8-3]|uniref:hypothetical protein n=1 Tax=Mesorhizobium sp. L-8-3 TaxID=2744522 RepID=UPI001927B421|nr:hypothetical protein [Mesorhizobium sp. L-8-3]BCH27805.1 hypothetical protein MesoLjLb_75900 [Mesorhizobium sp. L-8-3]